MLSFLHDNLCFTSTHYYSFEINPGLTRGEIRELWSTLLTNKDGSLSWQEFIRQFGFTGQTHSYPDAGRNPPKWGDSDYNLRSKHFNSDTEILVDGAKQKVRFRAEICSQIAHYLLYS